MILSEGIFKSTQHTAITYTTEINVTNPTDLRRKRTSTELLKKSGALEHA